MTTDCVHCAVSHDSCVWLYRNLHHVPDHFNAIKSQIIQTKWYLIDLSIANANLFIKDWTGCRFRSTFACMWLRQFSHHMLQYFECKTIQCALLFKEKSFQHVSTGWFICNLCRYNGSSILAHVKKICEQMCAFHAYCTVCSDISGNEFYM